MTRPKLVLLVPPTLGLPRVAPRRRNQRHNSAGPTPSNSTMSAPLSKVRGAIEANYGRTDKIRLPRRRQFQDYAGQPKLALPIVLLVLLVLILPASWTSQTMQSVPRIGGRYFGEGPRTDVLWPINQYLQHQVYRLIQASPTPLSKIEGETKARYGRAGTTRLVLLLVSTNYGAQACQHATFITSQPECQLCGVSTKLLGNASMAHQPECQFCGI